MTVILNQDFKRDKMTDDREVLSVGRLRLVATHMNRSLTKVKDMMSEKMVQAPPM